MWEFILKFRFFSVLHHIIFIGNNFFMIFFLSILTDFDFWNLFFNLVLIGLVFFILIWIILKLCVIEIFYLEIIVFINEFYVIIYWFIAFIVTNKVFILIGTIGYLNLLSSLKYHLGTLWNRIGFSLTFKVRTQILVGSFTLILILHL